ncbi:MAG: hypothetical protein JWN17_1903 [Frankiales bacterium]|nr:hypothetical protein [Frankiales bacterium]
MPHAYLSRLTTPSVEDAQERYGSRDVLARYTAGSDQGDVLGGDEADFIAERDTFFLATVGESGWPYVQHRGGPPGFVRVLDGGAALAWADVRGNRQYLSVGNLLTRPRVSLLFLDQAHALRLKVLGTAEVRDVRDGDPSGFVDQLVVPDGRATVERVIRVQVQGWDWNCPQHITPRYTAAELAPLHEEVARLREEVRQLRSSAGRDA